MKDKKHQFAFYTELLPDNLRQDTHYTISDKDLVHRLISIVRLDTGDSFVLFNRSNKYTCTIETYERRALTCLIQKSEKIVPLQPNITLLLPLLKRDALEDAIYVATILGINQVQLVTTEKSTAAWAKDKEADRLLRIAVAAAEQSKQYLLPTIAAPVDLAHALRSHKNYDVKLHADVNGANFYTTASAVRDKKSFLISVGPEGDLTSSEQTLLKEQGFTFCKLTPTVLKSEQALLLFAGLLRSF